MKEGTMLAAVFERAGQAEQVVQVLPLPIPEPGAGEVLVRMQAASLHPADRMFIAGAYRRQPVFPQRAGFVGTGVVARSGAGADIPAGTRIAFRHPGAWAEYCVVPVAGAFVVPEAVDATAASQFALNPLTAWGLLDAAGVARGDWLALNAAGSNVATMVRALASARGVRVVEIQRADSDGARDDGADLARTLLDATHGEPIAAVLDAVGGAQVREVLPALRQGGTIVSYGMLQDAPAPIRNADLIYRNLAWIGFGIDHWLARHAAQREAMARELWDAIATGALPLPVRARFPLAALGEALRADAAGGAGKVVLALGEGA